MWLCTSISVGQFALYCSEMNVCYALSSIVRFPYSFHLVRTNCSLVGSALSSSIAYRHIVEATCFWAEWNMRFPGPLLWLHRAFHESAKDDLQLGCKIWTPLTVPQHDLDFKERGDARAGVAVWYIKKATNQIAALRGIVCYHKPFSFLKKIQ